MSKRIKKGIPYNEKKQIVLNMCLGDTSEEFNAILYDLYIGSISSRRHSKRVGWTQHKNEMIKGLEV